MIDVLAGRPYRPSLTACTIGGIAGQTQPGSPAKIAKGGKTGCKNGAQTREDLDTEMACGARDKFSTARKAESARSHSAIGSAATLIAGRGRAGRSCGRLCDRAPQVRDMVEGNGDELPSSTAERAVRRDILGHSEMVAS